MNDNVPSVTVLIAARPDQTEIQAAVAARHLDYPPDRREILLAPRQTALGPAKRRPKGRDRRSGLFPRR